MCLFEFQGDLHDWDMVGLLTPISFLHEYVRSAPRDPDEYSGSVIFGLGSGPEDPGRRLLLAAAPGLL